MSYANGPKIVTDGLVLCLDAANRKSYPGTGSTWGDLSGNGNNGTLVNGVAYNSGNKGSLVFDGTNDYGSVSSVTPDIGDFTVGFIFQLTGTGGRGGIFERKPASPYNGFSLGQGGPNVWSANVTGGISNNVVYFTYPAVNIWYYDVLVYTNGKTVTGYRNGNFVGSTTGVDQGNLSSQGTRSNFLIANRDNITSLPCRVSFVSCYNKSLSASEILQNYNALKGRFGL